MGNLFVSSEGGLTAAGYALCLGILILCLLAGFALAENQGANNQGAKKRNVKHLAYCAMALALAYVTSYIKVFTLPYGGSVTLMSMLFIVLIAHWYGVRTGVLVGFAYGILQFLQEPYFLSLFQVCCDYVLARGVFHSIGGYLYWMDYMPENFPQALRELYPIVYNYSYLLAEGAVTVAVLKLPAVSQALERIRKAAI